LYFANLLFSQNFYISLDINDFFQCILINLILHQAMNIQNFSSSFAEVMFLSVVKSLRDKWWIKLSHFFTAVINSFTHGDLVFEDATCKRKLFQHLLILAASQDAYTWLILCDESWQDSCLGVDNDEVDAEILACLDCLSG